MGRFEAGVLNRSKLRDVVLLACLASALIYGVSTTGIVVGFAMLASGCLLHIVAKGILIRNVVLSSRGLYGLVRHPYYLANYLIDSSLCVLSGNPYLLLVYPFLFFWAYGPTVRSEEKLLNERYGEEFLSDSFRVPQVFPDVASLKGLRKLFDGFSLKRVTAKECSRIARFSAMGFGITLIHELEPEGLAGLKHLLIPTDHDYDEFVFMSVAATLFLLSLFFVRTGGKSRAGTGRNR